MFNTSTTNISYQIKDENGSVIYEGICPYGVLPYLQRSLLSFQPRTIEFTIGTQTFSSSRNYVGMFDSTQATDDEQHIANQCYNSLQVSKAYLAAMEESMAFYEIGKIEENAQLAATAQEELRQASFQAQLYFEETLASQNILQETYFQELHAEQQRLDLLRVQTVTQIAVDPINNVIPALMSEVGKNGDVQRQIAQSMIENPEVTKVVLAGNAELWNSSYDILEVAARQAVMVPEVASLLGSKISEDSLLYRSLKLLNLI